MTILNAPPRVRAFVCELFVKDAVKGPLWKIYETQEYDQETDTVTIYGTVFKVEEEN